MSLGLDPRKYVASGWRFIQDRTTAQWAQDLSERLDRLVRDLSEKAMAKGDQAPGVPAGTIIFFDGLACPAGYSPVLAAADRVLRGMGAGSPGDVGGDDSHDHTMNHGHGGSIDYAPSHTHSITTDGAHSHYTSENLGTNFASGGSYMAANASSWTDWRGAHNHGGYVGSDGSHNHGLTISGHTGDTGSSSNLPAFIQFLVCRKD